jgi:alkanesulfonate monooxygenase SsuD/methylene tetrahydromethanopterin reductase-like flavin-dependent oxidoreductase (luciferase family)
MKFRYHTAFNDPELKLGFTNTLRNALTEIKFVEKLGFDGIWIGEHHLGPEGLSNLPNPILLQAYIVAQTKFNSYGLCCVIAPTWHPVRLAEDIATLDHMTGGKLHVGFARGVYPRDTMPFHPNADCRSNESRILTSEVIDVVLMALKEDFFSHKGPNFTLPPPGVPHHPWSKTEEPYVDDNGHITKLCIVPKPVQRPFPPVWVMATQVSSVRLAAELGHNVMAAGSALNMIREWMEIYQEIRSRKAGRDFAKGEGWAIQRPLYIADTMEQAEKEYGPYLYRQRQYQALYRADPAAYVRNTLGENVSAFDWNVFQKSGAVFAGTAADVGEQIQQIADLGINAMNVWTEVAGMPHEMSIDVLARFGEEVMPRFAEISVAA